MTIFFPPQQRLIDLEVARISIPGSAGIPVELPMAGKQGRIYRSHKMPRTLFKIYEPHMVYPEMERTINLIKQVCLDIPNICQIISPIFDKAAGNCIGFAMPEITNATYLKDAKLNTAQDRIKACQQLASACFALQLRGAGPADLHDQNILVEKTGWLWIIDVDSFFILERTFDGVQIEHHPQLGTLEFSAYELLGNHAEIRHSHETAAYSLAVILYQILKGHHPAQLRNTVGRILPASDIISRGFYGRFSEDRKGLEIIDAGIPWADIPGNLRHLFERAFGAGLEDPTKRPLAQQWHEAIDEWVRGQVRPVGVTRKRHLVASFLMGMAVTELVPKVYPLIAETKTPEPPAPQVSVEDVRARIEEATKKIEELKKKGAASWLAEKPKP